MPAGVDEVKWRKAKKIAAKQGHAGNYTRIKEIYKKLMGH
jgi:hypothetical protein